MPTLRPALLAPVLLLLVACPDPTEPFSCVESSECDGGEICQDGGCEQILGQTFRLIAWSASVDEQLEWDADGSAPDAYVAVDAGEELPCRTRTQPDDLTPDWDQFCEVEFTSSTEIEISLWDEDDEDPEDDWLGNWVWGGQLELIELARRGQEFTLRSDNAELLMGIELAE